MDAISFRMICEGGNAITLVDEMSGSADHKITVFTEALRLPDDERARLINEMVLHLPHPESEKDRVA